MTIWFVLLSAGIKTSAFQMSKFRDSITLSIFSLSTLSNYHYWQSPKTRYWRLVRPYQTGIPPARLLALVWAHNSDLSICFIIAHASSFTIKKSNRIFSITLCRVVSPLLVFCYHSNRTYRFPHKLSSRYFSSTI